MKQDDQGRVLTARQNRQLVREGQAQKDHRYRPHAIPLHHLPALQERLPDWHPQELPWSPEGIDDKPPRQRGEGSVNVSETCGQMSKMASREGGITQC